MDLVAPDHVVAGHAVDDVRAVLAAQVVVEFASARAAAAVGDRLADALRRIDRCGLLDHGLAVGKPARVVPEGDAAAVRRRRVDVDAVAAGAAVDAADHAVAVDVDHVVAVPGVDAVGAAVEVDRVVAGPAEDVIAARSAVQRVVAVAALDAIGRRAAVQVVVTDAAVEGVVPEAAGRGVVAGIAGQHVIARATVDRVVARAASDVVRAGVSRDTVVAAERADAIRAAEAVELVRAFGAPRDSGALVPLLVFAATVAAGARAASSVATRMAGIRVCISPVIGRSAPILRRRYQPLSSDRSWRTRRLEQPTVGAARARRVHRPGPNL